MELKDRIILYRAKKSLTQAEFGELIGVKRRAVIDYEQGSMPNKIAMAKISLLLSEEGL